MHHFLGESCYVNFNSDLSGKILVAAKVGASAVEVDFQDLADFVDLARGRQVQEKQDDR